MCLFLGRAPCEAEDFVADIETSDGGPDFDDGACGPVAEALGVGYLELTELEW